jgi:D-alanyl-D-alanine carboxypeptidase/D-alanyl-D-alanine-endopeptidase (penicillin-binding protein 4)
MPRRCRWGRTLATGTGAAALAVALGVGLLPAPASAAPVTAAVTAGPTAAEQRIARKLTARVEAPRLGDSVTGLVLDRKKGRVVWQQHGDYQRLPASTTKLVTALAALRTFGTDKRFATTVVQGARRRQIVLVGSGDPELRRWQLGRLANRTTAALHERGRRKVTLLVDDSKFPAPTLATGWSPYYYPHEIVPLRALGVHGREVMDSALDAGGYFARALKRRGIAVSDVRRERRPGDAKELARVRGLRLDSIVRRMLLVSDNQDAEHLLRLVAIGNGQPATWAGSNAAVRSVLAKLDVPLAGMALYDGSGLSRSDRLTARNLADVLRAALSPYRSKIRAAFLAALPVAGVSGTLGANYSRYVTKPTTCAAGRLQGKTGSLRDVITLAGVTTARDGREKVWAFLVYGQPAELATRRAVDRLATTVQGCW